MVNAQDADKLMIRLPEGLRQKIKVAAALNERSMNAEVVYHLKRAFGALEKEKGEAPA
ncbi:Arc family DNA-binding protein [Sinorhizobium medicae]|uniref:Arc family DNA-binding protein n=1 Tax=Sinorhizobium medicae TaxID=110321 RepID=UPI002AF6B0AE|nr:Arc family DNA-binding protein [Sinorhizobium medicae]WQO53299.1 Arc family DNA-binding protein [Sinorhizobium medicae]WQO73995.1 Arc family DNA-binding protein [Sinorhizobium medicae]